MAIQNIFIIGLGGFLGTVARYAIGLWIGQKWGRTFPLGTFLINVSGSFLIGFLMMLFTERLMLNPQWRMFFVIGFLGAYTTFSTFEYETGALLRDGEWFIASLNVALSVIIGFVALKFGEGAARML
jgi:CrcB protein